MKRRIYRTVVVPWRRHMKMEVNTGTIIPPSGILFHGPSGCGKTMAANCLGSSLGLPMIQVRAVDVLDKWLGGSEAILRSLFNRARNAAPCILFFDEIDAIANNRAKSDGVTADVMSRLLSTLLNEMDGISNSHQSNVIIIACTNRIESLDAALLRPGRLEEHIFLTFPNEGDAYEIIQQKLALVPLHTSIDLQQIAFNLVKLSASCADIEGTCREAVYRAIRRCSNQLSNVSVTAKDIEDGIAAIKL
jgi:transitional endoplasmic reticulum ATPase